MTHVRNDPAIQAGARCSRSPPLKGVGRGKKTPDLRAGLAPRRPLGHQCGMTNTLYYGDNLHVLREHVKDESVDLICPSSEHSAQIAA